MGGVSRRNAPLTALRAMLEQRVSTIDVPRDMPSWAALVPEPKTGALDFERFPFQRELYAQATDDRELVVMKGTQLGISTWALAGSCSTPTCTGARAFMSSRRRPPCSTFPRRGSSGSSERRSTCGPAPAGSTERSGVDRGGARGRLLPRVGGRARPGLRSRGHSRGRRVRHAQPAEHPGCGATKHARDFGRTDTPFRPGKLKHSWDATKHLRRAGKKQGKSNSNSGISGPLAAEA